MRGGFGMGNENESKKSEEDDFKEAMFKAFSEKCPGTYIDEDGFIVIPAKRRKREHDQNPPKE